MREQYNTLLGCGLLSLIKSGNKSAKSKLKKNLAKVNDEWRTTLLHCAAADDQDVIVKHLIDAGCPFYIATFLQNVSVLESLLKRGYDINCHGIDGTTALHIATEEGNVVLAKWLIDNGADIDALDVGGSSPLFVAARSANIDMLKLLLGVGANPNITNRLGFTPLHKLCVWASKSEGDKCVELMLQHGAIPMDGRGIYSRTIFDCTLVAQLAFLDKLNKTVAISVIYRIDPRYQKSFAEIQKYYERCQRMLEVVMFDSLTLFDLLAIGRSKHEMKKRVRNKMFVSAIKNVCSKYKLSDASPYFNILFNNVFSAVHEIELENKAISIICDIFNWNHEEFYLAGRKIVGYLSVNDLEQLNRA